MEEEMQQPTHFVIYYPGSHELAVEPEDRLENVVPDFYSLLRRNTTEMLYVSVPYEDVLYDGIVISGCSKRTAQDIYECCVGMRQIKHKPLEAMLKEFPRLVPLHKRLKFPNYQVSYMHLP